MHHVLRPYHVLAWDWVVDPIDLNSNLSVKYVHPKQHIADILTNGSFAREKRNELVNLFGVLPESSDRRPISVVAALVPFAHKMAQRSRLSTDQVSKFESASSKSMPEGKRAFALAAVKLQKSSPLISAQEKDAIRCPRPEEPRRGIG